LKDIAQHRQAILDRQEGRPLEFDLGRTIDHIREERDDELNTSSIHRC
jgi:hypothetical protein